MFRALVAFTILLAAAGCATPLNLRPVPLARDGRTIQNLFMGGWDGHRLDMEDDGTIEPGVTHGSDVAHELAQLSSDLYAVIYVERDQLTPDVATPHGIFCDLPVCLVVLDRKGGEDLSTYGQALLVIEMTAAPDEIVKRVWMDGRVVRPPGPMTWPRYCLNAKDTPHYLHPDGAAIFPARPSPKGDGYALFGPKELPAKYMNEGYEAPDETNTCVEPPDEDETIPAAPAPAAGQPAPAPDVQPATTHSSHHHRRHHDD